MSTREMFLEEINALSDEESAFEIMEKYRKPSVEDRNYDEELYEELLQRFKQVKSQVRPAIENMMEEAERVAVSESEYMTYEDVFGAEEKVSKHFDNK